MKHLSLYIVEQFFVIIMWQNKKFIAFCYRAILGKINEKQENYRFSVLVINFGENIYVVLSTNEHVQTFTENL